MSNANHRVVNLTFYLITIYIGISIIDIYFQLPIGKFSNINLISAIVKMPIKAKIAKDSIAVVPIKVVPEPKKNFELYLQKEQITAFNTDSNSIALNKFIQKIAAYKSGKNKRKIRVAYLGDSIIEGDLMTQTFRRLMQAEFGGSGVGFVPITSQVAKYRQSVIATYSTNWEDNNFKTKGDKSNLYLSGHQFTGPGEWVKLSDQVIKDSLNLIEKTLICGKSDAPITLNINKNPTILNATKGLNRIVLQKDKSRVIELQFGVQKFPIYGITFESETGIIVDNFSFRGISGIEYKNIDTSFLKQIQVENPYDLIVLQFGVNVLYKPETTNFNFYEKLFEPVLVKFRHCFPEAEILVIGSTDRAFRYPEGYSSAIGIDSLIKLQAAMAYKNNANFYNQYATMGGKNSLVKWAEQNPPLANKDYIHPNPRGAEVLGKFLFNAVMKEYRKYIVKTH
jgi:lysophospholipase L1-like esterase